MSTLIKHPSAMPGCDNCLGTGEGIRYGHGPCPCLAHCDSCMDALIPWEDDGEGGHVKGNCAECEALDEAEAKAQEVA
jgi:hypothetical protein